MILLLNSIGLCSLLGISIWLGYLNYQLLKVTRDIRDLTLHIDIVSAEICYLTEALVTNTSMPSQYP